MIITKENYIYTREAHEKPAQNRAEQEDNFDTRNPNNAYNFVIISRFMITFLNMIHYTEFYLVRNCITSLKRLKQLLPIECNASEFLYLSV